MLVLPTQGAVPASASPDASASIPSPPSIELNRRIASVGPAPVASLAAIARPEDGPGTACDAMHAAATELVEDLHHHIHKQPSGGNAIPALDKQYHGELKILAGYVRDGELTAQDKEILVQFQKSRSARNSQQDIHKKRIYWFPQKLLNKAPCWLYSDTWNPRTKQYEYCEKEGLAYIEAQLIWANLSQEDRNAWSMDDRYAEVFTGQPNAWAPYANGQRRLLPDRSGLGKDSHDGSAPRFNMQMLQEIRNEYLNLPDTPKRIAQAAEKFGLTPRFISRYLSPAGEFTEYGELFSAMSKVAAAGPIHLTHREHVLRSLWKNLQDGPSEIHALHTTYQLYLYKHLLLDALHGSGGLTVKGRQVVDVVQRMLPEAGRISLLHFFQQNATALIMAPTGKNRAFPTLIQLLSIQPHPYPAAAAPALGAAAMRPPATAHIAARRPASPSPSPFAVKRIKAYPAAPSPRITQEPEHAPPVPQAPAQPQSSPPAQPRLANMLEVYEWHEMKDVFAALSAREYAGITRRIARNIREWRTLERMGSDWFDQKFEVRMGMTQDSQNEFSVFAKTDFAQYEVLGSYENPAHEQSRPGLPALAASWCPQGAGWILAHCWSVAGNALGLIHTAVRPTANDRSTLAAANNVAAIILRPNFIFYVAKRDIKQGSQLLFHCRDAYHPHEQAIKHEPEYIVSD